MAGHPQLLGWLLRRCPGLLQPQRVPGRQEPQHGTAAWRGGAAGGWEALQSGPGSGGSSGDSSRGAGSSGGRGPGAALGQKVLDAAARSATLDAVAKMEWLLGVAGASCRLQESTAVAAARADDLARLQWLRGHVCPVAVEMLLLVAPEHASLAMVQWLVDEAGCRLPEARDGEPTCTWDWIRC